MPELEDVKDNLFSAYYATARASADLNLVPMDDATRSDLADHLKRTGDWIAKTILNEKFWRGSRDA